MGLAAVHVESGRTAWLNADEAAELGVDVQLSCRAFNEGARRFYEQAGYEVVQLRLRKRT